jgi:hypothetical protein
MLKSSKSWVVKKEGINNRVVIVGNKKGKKRLSSVYSLKIYNVCI